VTDIEPVTPEVSVTVAISLKAEISPATVRFVPLASVPLRILYVVPAVNLACDSDMPRRAIPWVERMFALTFATGVLLMSVITAV